MQRWLRGAPRLVAACFLISTGGCLGPEVDRIKDPVAKAEYNCRYHLERSVAKVHRPQALDPDGVLRRSIATFHEPEIIQTGTLVEFTWPSGGIKLQGSTSVHSGTCTMDVSNGQQLVASAKLDGRELHSGFRF